MKLTAQQYHKKKLSSHEWKVTYIDAQSGKQHSFTCSNAMKRSHELLMQSKYVKDVKFERN